MTDITGNVCDIDGKPNLVILRRFRATADEVWRELTDSARLERWIGRWEGDPASGHVTFYMTAEDPDAAGEEYTILECDRPGASPATLRPGRVRGTCGSSSPRTSTVTRCSPSASDWAPRTRSARSGRAGSTTSIDWWPAAEAGCCAAARRFDSQARSTTGTRSTGH